jgi:hypothetical protein
MEKEETKQRQGKSNQGTCGKRQLRKIREQAAIKEHQAETKEQLENCNQGIPGNQGRALKLLSRNMRVQDSGHC